MTPKQLRATLQALRWRSPTLAQAMGADPKTVLHMLAGKRKIPEGIAHWLTEGARYFKAHPDCPDWRVMPGHVLPPKQRIKSAPAPRISPAIGDDDQRDDAQECHEPATGQRTDPESAHEPSAVHPLAECREPDTDLAQVPEHHERD